MQSHQTGWLPKATARTAAVSLMLALWLATVLVSLSPCLHETLHSDSQSANHACLVTLLGKSHVVSGLASVVVPAPSATAVELDPVPAPLLLSSPDYSLCPSRGPPARLPLQRG